MLKSKFKKFLIVICCVFLIFGILLTLSLLNKDNIDVVLRNDKEPILKRFPLIGNIEKCYWEADIIGNSSWFSVPAPSSYWMKGYVFLDMIDIENIKNQYEWVSVEDNWTPSLDLTILSNKSLKWYYSQEYTDNIKSILYIGFFYINFENGIIYFEVEK